MVGIQKTVKFVITFVGIRYDGSISWWADICTIAIVGYFEFTPHIVPACLEFIENPYEMYPVNGSLAKVAGWGLTEVNSLQSPKNSLKLLLFLRILAPAGFCSQLKFQCWTCRLARSRLR